MPTQLELSAEPRDVFGKHVKRLRREGIIPANIYGHGASRAIQAPARALDRLLTDGGRTSVITIAFDGRSETALLKTLQRDPRSGQIIHADFQAVSMDQEVSSVVPIHFFGESDAVTKLDGVMTHPRNDLHVTARAANLPDTVEVDLSVITELHGAIHVSDLPSSSTYVVTDPGEEVLAMVLPPVREADDEAEAGAEAAEPAAPAESAAAAEGEARGESESAEAATDSESA